MNPLADPLQAHRPGRFWRVFRFSVSRPTQAHTVDVATLGLFRPVDYGVIPGTDKPTLYKPGCTASSTGPPADLGGNGMSSHPLARRP